MRRFLQLVNYYFEAALTWIFYKLVDNPWVVNTFPSSLDLAVRLILVRNGVNVEGRSRLQLATLSNLPNHILIEAYKLFLIAKAIENAKKNGGLLTILSKIVDNPKEYLIEKKDCWMGNKVFYPYFYRNALV